MNREENVRIGHLFINTPALWMKERVYPDHGKLVTCYHSAIFLGHWNDGDDQGDLYIWETSYLMCRYGVYAAHYNTAHIPGVGDFQMRQHQSCKSTFLWYQAALRQAKKLKLYTGNLR